MKPIPAYYYAPNGRRYRCMLTATYYASAGVYCIKIGKRHKQVELSRVRLAAEVDAEEKANSKRKSA